ncbi:MAG: hypothetical protein ACYST3_07880 [Planctomycetota bacterium]|jgi:hypothetical protein
MHKQDSIYNSAKYTAEELLSMFKTEAQSICKKPADVLSIAESTLSDFIKSYGEYVRLV